MDEQFLELQQLQDETSPNFVYDVVNIYFQESEKLIRNLRALLYVTKLSLSLPSTNTHAYIHITYIC